MYLLEEADAHGTVSGGEHLNHHRDDLLLVLFSTEEFSHLKKEHKKVVGHTHRARATS